MPDLTHKHLETFVFDPHCAAEPEIAAMARELISARARLAELPQSEPIAYMVAHTACDGSTSFGRTPYGRRANAEAHAARLGSAWRVVELREVNGDV